MEHEIPSTESPVDAAPPGTRGPTRTYDRAELRVLWNATLCVHVGNCLRALPEVFDTKARPWVNVSGATADAVAEAIRSCPSGALRYVAHDDFPPEQPDTPTSVEPQPGGPLFVRGDLDIAVAPGDARVRSPRAALCRCGGTTNRPFCDNTHRLRRQQMPTTKEN